MAHGVYFSFICSRSVTVSTFIPLRLTLLDERGRRATLRDKDGAANIRQTRTGKVGKHIFLNCNIESLTRNFTPD